MARFECTRGGGKGNPTDGSRWGISTAKLAIDAEEFAMKIEALSRAAEACGVTDVEAAAMEYRQSVVAPECEAQASPSETWKVR